MKCINKTMDRNDLETDEALIIIDELNSLVSVMRKKHLRISSWYGTFDLKADPKLYERLNRGYGYEGIKGAADDMNFPWFLYWEIVWVILNGEFGKESKILDLGGSSSLFSYYLAWKGLDVTTIDLQRSLVDNANYVAARMGWNLRNYVMDMRQLNFESEFDHITSICVYEHIPRHDRIVISKRVKSLLTNGGRFSITFDYRTPDKLAHIRCPQDIYEQIVKPSGLKVRGNEVFFDNGKNYLLDAFYSRKSSWLVKTYLIMKGQYAPWEIFKRSDTNNYTFGALFMEKREGN